MDKKRTPPFEIPADAYKKFAEYAETNGKSVSQAIREAMEEYLKQKTGTHTNFTIGSWGGWRGDRERKRNPAIKHSADDLKPKR